MLPSTPVPLPSLCGQATGPGSKSSLNVYQVQANCEAWKVVSGGRETSPFLLHVVQWQGIEGS